METIRQSNFGTITQMKRLNYLLIALILLLLATSFYLIFLNRNSKDTYIGSRIPNNEIAPTLTSQSPSSAPMILKPIPKSKILENNYYAKQTFNNCGPASLSMALSYYGIEKSQHELGQILRPYQNPIGDNDDKSVTLTELANHAKTYGFFTYHRPNGDVELLKKFITYDIPVITRTWLHVNEDIGHYRMVKGYDDNSQTIIQDDSYEGSDLSFSYSDFNIMWSKFDYEYMVLIPNDKKLIAEEIIGANLDDSYAWGQAVKRNNEILQQNPNDIYSRFNLSVAYYHLKDYEKSVKEFEMVESQLPFRTLWYQIEPILSYYELKNYNRVFSITDKILGNYNRAFSELYVIRGKIYQNQGDPENARSEYEKAVFYNNNLKEAQELLNSL